MKKILALEKHPLVRTECWTSECLAIMQTNPEYKIWIATHAEIYLSEKFGAMLGPVDKCYRIINFSSMLSFKEIPIYETPPQSIIQTIIQEISKNTYIIIFLTNPTTNFRHEVIVYGFDTDQSVLHTYSIIDGVNKIAFNKVEIMYTITFNTLKNQPSDLQYFHTFFPITAVSLKSDSPSVSIGIDVCKAEAMKTLSFERNGNIYLKKESLTSSNEEAEDYLLYSGLSCLKGIHKLIKKMIQDKQFIHDTIFEDLSNKLAKSMFKLYEHREMICITLNWLNAQVNHNSENKHISEYKHFTEQFNKMSMLTLKFYKTGDWSILENILKDLDSQYAHEYKILGNFLSDINEDINKLFIFHHESDTVLLSNENHIVQ